MAARSLRRIIEDMPDWLTPEQTADALAEILAATDEDADPVGGATALSELLARAAENPEGLGEDGNRAVLAWLGQHWAAEPASHFGTLCALAVNVELEEAGALLSEKLAEETDAARRAMLEKALADRAPETDEAEGADSDEA